MHSIKRLIDTAFKHIKIHLSRISCLQLNLNPIELPLEPIFGASINHLAPYPWNIRTPSNKSNKIIYLFKINDKKWNIQIYKLTVALRSKKLTLPSYEENSAFLAILLSDKIKIINSISTLVSRKISSEIIITICRITNLVHNNLLLLLLNLVNDIPIGPLRLELQKL